MPMATRRKSCDRSRAVWSKYDPVSSGRADSASANRKNSISGWT
jgi:hypothetical protein